MKKLLKIASVCVITVIFLSALSLAIVFLTPSKIMLDPDKLEETTKRVDFYDENDDLISVTDGKNYKSANSEYSALIKNAFIATEDKNFYKHNGLDFKRMIKAFLVNLKNLSYKQGASTITQQLVKNTHLTSQKTLARKIEEIKLAVALEKSYPKDKIITMYLNTIYFGENTFGLYNAGMHYFNLPPEKLSLAQIATLAGIISAPSKLNPNKNKLLCLKKRNKVIETMHRLGYIDENQKNTAINEELIVYKGQKEPYESYVKACMDEIETEYGASPYSLKDCKILTYYNSALQKELSDYENSSDYQAIVLDNKNAGVKAYFSTAGELSRDIASLGKPLYVYAPAIEENYLTKYTKITDEPCDFDGYKPKNYGDKYYGDVSVADAIKKSLNVPAVKILDCIGIDKAKYYAEKLGLSVRNNGLSLALGNLGNGEKLKNVAAAYSTFANLGEYQKPHFVRKIIFNGKVFQSDNSKKTKIFSPSTASVINDILQETVKSGTAKKLSYLDFNVCAKTGTNGINENNYDCYSVAYTTENTVAVWLGNKDNAPVKNETGSKTPTTLVGKYLEFLYKNHQPDNFKSYGLKKVFIDKISYEKDGKILLADENTPEKYLLEFTLSDKSAPNTKSERFTSFKDLSVSVKLNKNVVSFECAIPEYASVEIIRSGEGKDTLIYSGRDNFEDTLIRDGLYDYFVVYTIKGKSEIKSGKIKLKSVFFDNKKAVGENSDDRPEDWWEN